MTNVLQSGLMFYRQVSYCCRHNKHSTNCEDLTRIRLMTSAREILLTEIKCFQAEEFAADYVTRNNCNTRDNLSP